MDIQELKIDEISTDTLNITEKDSNDLGGKKSVNFGPGADLLMNPNRQSQKPKSSGDISLSDLDSLDGGGSSDKKSLKEARDNIFADIKLSNIDETGSGGNISLDVNDIPEIKLDMDKPDSGNDNGIMGGLKGILKGAASNQKTETNDGFKRFNEIPVNPNVVPPKKPKMSQNELLKEKFKYLRLLESIEQKGITLSKKYSMDSSLDEMKGEYETLKSEKEKSNSVKFQGKMLMAFVSGLEFLNNRFDPFDLKLDGWAESVNENIDEYDDVFGELHEKYGGNAKMAPELKLLFMLGGSAVMLHMTNTMFKSAMPGMDDIMRQNPELMQQFTQAAASSMADSNPGLGGFMNMMGGIDRKSVV